MIKPVIIGNATLYLGDCRDIVPHVQFDSIASDPPYGMSFQSNRREVQHRAIANDQNEELLLWACSLRPRHSSYLFCRWDNLATVPKPKSCVTWVKNVHSMGDLEHEHARQTEIALFYPGPEHDFPKGRPNDVVKAPKTGNGHHPTEKPVQLLRHIISASCVKGEVVLDMFAGSGSTLVAADQVGCKFIGIEKHEDFFRSTVERVAQDLHINKPELTEEA